MDAPKDGPAAAACSRLEQQLLEHVRCSLDDLRALAEDRARLTLQVIPPHPGVSVALELPVTAVPHESVVAVGAAARARCSLEADLVEAALEVAVECRARVLERRGLTGVALSPATARSIDAAVRDAASRELELATGVCQAEAQTLLGVTTAGGTLRTMLLACLRRGQARWSQVRTYWERTARARLTQDQRLLVAHALFGTDPGLACAERLDPDGHLDLRTPWMYHPFLAALTREIAACQGQDPEADAHRRRRAYEQRRVQVRLHDDGTGTLTMTGPVVTVAGIRHRLDTAARNLLAAGDDRTLAQARFDLAAALDLHGILDLDDVDLGRIDELLAPERLAELMAVVHAQPRIHAQIIVPADALRTGVPLCPTCAGQIRPAATDPSTGATTSSDPSRVDSAASPDSDPPDRRPHSPFLDREPPGRGLVGELTGAHPLFLTPGHARELVLLPGTTLHRLLTDPADGRLVERTIATYRPDADMRRQVHAADLYSRAPGSRLSGRALEIDHVIPWGTPGGETTETTLAALDRRTHHAKTVTIVRLEIGARRDCTFTTLLDQQRRTRVHDCNQYLRTAHPDDLDARRDLAGRAIYANEAQQHRGRLRRHGRADPQDHGWVSLTHTDPGTGRTRPGPHPDTPTLGQVLSLPDEELPHDTTAPVDPEA